MEGSLTHQDSMGTAETLHRGAIQFMTAGTGVYHQEHNKNTETPLRFIQMWINTRTRGLRPNYGSFQGDEASRRAGWAHIVGDVNKSGGAKPPIEINQDANLYVTELSDATEPRSITIAEGRQAYLLCVEGSTEVTAANIDNNSNEVQKDTLHRHDAMEIFGPLTLTVTKIDSDQCESTETGNSITDSHLLLVEMKFSGKGRHDLR